MLSGSTPNKPPEGREGWNEYRAEKVLIEDGPIPEFVVVRQGERVPIEQSSMFGIWPVSEGRWISARVIATIDRRWDAPEGPPNVEVLCSTPNFEHIAWALLGHRRILVAGEREAAMSDGVRPGVVIRGQLVAEAVPIWRDADRAAGVVARSFVSNGLDPVLAEALGLIMLVAL